MATADPLLGAIVDERWKVIEQIGAGGYGTVYRAERVKLGKSVAVKFLDEKCAQSKEAVARFDREARAISRVHHAHCVGILDFGVYGKRPYIVMEYVKGKRLALEMGKPQLTLERAVSITRQLLEGLRHAHAHGVVHRDLKPDNVMLMEVTGNPDFVKILDFGLARIISVDEPSLSLQPVVAGTPSYMSPEQAQAKKVDHRTDLYSVGVMLFAMCTGKRPFWHEDDIEILRMHLKAQVPQPRKVAPERGISPSLERVILRALEKDRDRRFVDAAEFLDALAGTPEGRAGARRPAKRAAGALVAVIVGVAAVAMIGTGAMMLWKRRAKGMAKPPVASAVTPPAPHAPPPPLTPPPPSAPAAMKTFAVESGIESGHESASAAAVNVNVNATPASNPDESEKAPAEILALVEGGKLDAAQKALIALQQSKPKAAWVHRELGDVYFRKLWRKDAAAEWDEALRLDPSLRADEKLGEELCAALHPAWKGMGERVIVARVGENAVGAMNACMLGARDLPRVQAAARVIERVAGAKAVDRGLVALRTVELGATCEQRKAAVETVAKLKDARAPEALGKLAADPCVGESVKRALVLH